MAELNLYYGDTGTGKTNALGKLAEYRYEQTGLPGRIIYSDPAGWKTMQGQVDAGFLEPYNLTHEADILVIIRKLARGYWPEQLVNGRRPPGAKLLRPKPGEPRRTGFYMWEGMTSSAELFMKSLRDKQVSMGGDPVGQFQIGGTVGKQVFKPEDPAVLDKEESHLFCSNNMKHFGWVQDEILSLLGEFTGLDVDTIDITSHEATGTDEDRNPIRGPGLVGKSGTVRVGKNVGNMLHFDVETKGTEVIYRAYFRPHPDPKFPNIRYDSKARVPDELIDPLVKEMKGNFFDPKDIVKFMKTMARLEAGNAQAAAGRKAVIDAALAKRSSAIVVTEERKG